MQIDKEIFDETVLIEFELTHLWFYSQDIVKYRDELVELKKKAIELGKLKDAAFHENQIYFVNRNLEILIWVLEAKEFEMFDFTPFGEKFSIN